MLNSLRGPKYFLPQINNYNQKSEWLFITVQSLLKNTPRLKYIQFATSKVLHQERVRYQLRVRQEECVN